MMMFRHLSEVGREQYACGGRDLKRKSCVQFCIEYTASQLMSADFEGTLRGTAKANGSWKLAF